MYNSKIKNKKQKINANLVNAINFFFLIFWYHRSIRIINIFYISNYKKKLTASQKIKARLSTQTLYVSNFFFNYLGIIMWRGNKKYWWNTTNENVQFIIIKWFFKRNILFKLWYFVFFYLKKKVIKKQNISICLFFILFVKSYIW